MTDFEPPVEVRILDPRLREWGLPTYQTDLAAGIDLFACLNEPLILQPQAARHPDPQRHRRADEPQPYGWIHPCAIGARP